MLTYPAERLSGDEFREPIEVEKDVADAFRVLRDAVGSKILWEEEGHNLEGIVGSISAKTESSGTGYLTITVEGAAEGGLPLRGGGTAELGFPESKLYVRGSPSSEPGKYEYDVLGGAYAPAHDVHITKSVPIQ